MSQGILLFGVVAAALVTSVHLDPTFVVKTEVKAGMEVVFAVNGSDNFHLDFLTADCEIAMRANFTPKQNRIIMNTFKGQKWGEAKIDPHKFQHDSRVIVKVTKDNFNITLLTHASVGRRASWHWHYVKPYNHSLPLKSITHVLVNGEQNLTDLFMTANGSRLQTLDDWMQPDTSGIRFFGTVTSDFFIDLLTNDSVALRMSFHSSSISRNSRINGIWGDEETDGAFALQLGQEIAVHILATKDGYQMKVNGTVFGIYGYRVDARLVDSMEVNGLSDVYIVYTTDPQETTESIPCKAILLM